MKTITFYNSKSRVGKTSLVYHLAWMFADQGVATLAVDLDPQANLTALLLDEERLEGLWPEEGLANTVVGALKPILDGLGDIADPHLETITEGLWLLPGDLGLSQFEDRLSDAWPRCHNRDASAFRVMTAFHRLMARAAAQGADVLLIDVGPNLGAINRSALIASDQVAVPLAPDLYSLQGLRNLAPSLRSWRDTWTELRDKAPEGLDMPSGSMEPVGYIVMQHGIRGLRPDRAYERWNRRIPSVYREHILGQPTEGVTPEVQKDEHCLALLKHYPSLMPLAMEAHKPMFFLKAADGAIGAHMEAVKDCYADFLALAQRIAGQAGIAMG